MKPLLIITILALVEFSVFSQTNTAAYDQLMTLAGTFINNGNLDAAKQTAQQVLQLDNQNWRGNALMAAILEKQGDFTNAQIYIHKAIANAPEDKKVKLNTMAQNIATSASQGATTVSQEMSPEARIKYDALMLIAQQADQATTEDDRKKELRAFMAKSVEFLELVPNQTDVWVLRALTAVELDYPIDGFYAGRRLKELGLEASDDHKVQKAFAELDVKGWLGNNIKFRDWSRWTINEVTTAAHEGDEEAEYELGQLYESGSSGLNHNETEATKWFRKSAEQGNAWAQNNLGVAYRDGEGVTKDYPEAEDLFQQAAAQGFDTARDNLGFLYEN